MASSRGRSGSLPPFQGQSQDDSIINTRALEAFGRKVTATAGQLLGPSDPSNAYHSALGDIQRELRHPILQRQVFSLARASPRELVRSKLSVNEIQHRALTYLPDELLLNIPETSSPYSLFQGFQASIPDHGTDKDKRKHKRQSLRKSIDAGRADDAPPALSSLRNEKQGLDHRLEMLGIRKNMCSTEIREIDAKISNLNNMRKIVLDRLADLEQEEAQLEHDILDIDTRIDDLEEDLEDSAALAGSGKKTPSQSTDAPDAGQMTPSSPGMEASFMSESIYQKIPTPKSKRPKPGRRKTTFILHEHLQAGSKLRELQAHNDLISALDFDAPFGTMVTAALDDTVRVWDLNAGRCMGLLEGHLSSVRCLQVEDNIVATGSMDASVRLWDLSQADYTPPPDPLSSDDEEGASFEDAVPELPPTANNMRDTPLFTLTAHVAEVTALHMHNSTLVSGSADKTLRQWDLEKGRCVQTLDVLWAAAQASAASTLSPSMGVPTASGALAGIARVPARTVDQAADFVGAVQCFDAALACGTADGLVRLWDLRSGQVHRSLVGHTGPVTCLQFDDVHLVTGSLDRSIRIWDLRTGSITDAFAYTHPITSMMFDSRRIVAAAGESVVKVYDKTDGRQWDCGAEDLDAGDGVTGGGEVGGADVKEHAPRSVVERVRMKDGYLIEGRRDGVVGVWSC